MPKIFILIPDDYAAGGLQRSAIALRDCLLSRGYRPIIYSIRFSPGGLAEQDEVRRVLPGDFSGAFGWVRFVHSLRGLLRHEQPSAAIGFGLIPGVLVAVAGTAMKEITLVGSERAYPPATPVKRLYTVLRRVFFPRLDHVVCQTRGVAQWFEQSLGIEEERIAIIPNVVRPPRSGWKRTSYASSTDWSGRLVAVGRLDWQKGFDMALRAFALVAKHDPEASLLIVGEGPQQQELLAMRAELGLADRVDFRPPMRDLEPLWRDAYALLFTSRYEGFPNVLAEAMAHGVPAVSFDCPTGPSHLIADGNNGFLVPLGDVEAAAGRCLDLIRNPAERDRMGERAMAISKQYGIEKIAGLWAGLLDRAAAESSKPRPLVS